MLVHALGNQLDVATIYELHSLMIWLARLKQGIWPPERAALAVDAQNVLEAAEMGYNWSLNPATAQRLREKLRDPLVPPEQAIRAWADAYHRARLRSTDRVLIHKTPGLASHIAELRRVWPRCRIVHIMRHPGAVIASYLAAAWGPTTVREGIHWYVRRVKPAMIEGPSAPGYHELAYEALLTNPDVLLDALAADLALPRVEQRRWSLVPNLERIHGWRSRLDIADIRLIEREVAEVLPRWPTAWSASGTAPSLFVRDNG